VTPIQLAKAISIIANDGLEVQPHLVSGILDKEGRVHPVRRGKRPRKVITARSAERMRRILAQVVTEGTGKRAKLRNYAVGGKTGTAQKVVDGRYASTYIASFVGFTPVEEPELLTFVMVDEPEKGMYGGVVAAPIYKKINEFAVRRLRIQPQGLAANEADRSLAR
ncbi:MAG: penicillin-binding transpeptidase domain-containing protein, partial [Terriglobia bacterium]